MICPICSNIAPKRLSKGAVDYFQCGSCKTLFSLPLDNENMVGGGNEEQRNVVQNPLRISRLIKDLGLTKEMRVLDFGCGFGRLVNDIREAGFQCDGYDAYNPDYATLPPKDTYSIVTMVEVAEHLSHPFAEFDVINRSMKKGAILYIETSFVNIAAEENIPLEEFFYVNAEVGHSTIYSHHGLDVLLCLKGFSPILHIDRNTRLYTKR